MSIANISQVVRPTRKVEVYEPTLAEKRRKLIDLCYNSNIAFGNLPESERFATTTYGELCAGAGTPEERMDAIKGGGLSSATIKHYDIFTHKQSLDANFGRTRFPITSSPGITEFKGPRDCNAIRAWHEMSTKNARI